MTIVELALIGDWKEERSYISSVRIIYHCSRGVLQGLDTHHLKNRHEHPDFDPIP
jgi:hypothetical protein